MYYIVIEGGSYRTLGKIITGTKVITVNGQVPTFMNIVGRSFCRLIPFNAFSFLSESGIGWHDKISETRVVSNSYKNYNNHEIIDDVRE